MTALPDPDMQAEFYSGVTAKRSPSGATVGLLVTSLH